MPAEQSAKLPPPRANAYRDAWCGQVSPARVGEEVRVAGWVHRRRDHGGLVFVDLRDRTGLLQVVFNPETAPEAHARSHELRSEWVISVRGEVVRRSEETINREMATGEVEVRAADYEVLGERRDAGRSRSTRRRRWTRRCACATATSTCAASRCSARSSCATTSRRRSATTSTHAGFLDIETPILTRSTPEGARDFVVPSRLQRGSFYALPQSPQLFKQLLMIAGFERYYQIARCFRDEALRADRQLEFTQLDMEMAFVSEEDVMAVTEGVHLGGLRGRRRASSRRRSRACPTTRRSRASARTVPTCASAWRSATSASAAWHGVQGVPRRARRAAARCAASTPARRSCRAPSSTS